MDCGLWGWYILIHHRGSEGTERRELGEPPESVEKHPSSPAPISHKGLRSGHLFIKRNSSSAGNLCHSVKVLKCAACRERRTGIGGNDV